MKTDDLRVENIRPLLSPAMLHEEFPLTEGGSEMVSRAREEVTNILRGVDDRLLVVVGPCSVHDPKAALEYAGRLKVVAAEFTSDFCVVMRVYFEKPRTTIGWKGLINDPHLDGSYAINEGLRTARRLGSVKQSEDEEGSLSYVPMVLRAVIPTRFKKFRITCSPSPRVPR